jgi:hypothetical protein
MSKQIGTGPITPKAPLKQTQPLKTQAQSLELVTQPSRAKVDLSTNKGEKNLLPQTGPLENNHLQQALMPWQLEKQEQSDPKGSGVDNKLLPPADTAKTVAVAATAAVTGKEILDTTKQTQKMISGGRKVMKNTNEIAESAQEVLTRQQTFKKALEEMGDNRFFKSSGKGWQTYEADMLKKFGTPEAAKRAMSLTSLDSGLRVVRGVTSIFELPKNIDNLLSGKGTDEQPIWGNIINSSNVIKDLSNITRGIDGGVKLATKQVFNLGDMVIKGSKYTGKAAPLVTKIGQQLNPAMSIVGGATGIISGVDAIKRDWGKPYAGPTNYLASGLSIIAGGADIISVLPLPGSPATNGAAKLISLGFGLAELGLGAYNNLSEHNSKEYEAQQKQLPKQQETA